MDYLTTTYLTLSCIITFVYSQSKSPEVTTTLGKISGETILFSEDSFLSVSKEIDVYKGIPFAEAPVGDLRFEMPRPKVPWSGTLYATEYGPWCLQSAEPYVIGEEDCLHLNIFSPQSKPSNAAVMVFIHGGAFETGSGATDFYSGLVLAAAGDVIIVTINYRLDIYGFLTTGDDEYPGNVGLFDQLEALKWVNMNIGAFGGDPSRVTIFGQSAGSASVDYHLLSKKSWNYFSQAILQSGTSLSYWAYSEREDAKNLSIAVGQKVGCNYSGSREFIACLKGVDPRAVINATEGDWRPVVDGIFLERSPEMLIKSGDIKKNLTIIVGTNEDEGTLAYALIPEYATTDTPTISKFEFLNLIPTAFVPTDKASNHHIIDAISFEYTDWEVEDDPELDYFEYGVRLATDFWFLCPSDTVQRAHASAENKVYVYVMTHIPNVFVYGFPWIDSGHAEELQFVFGFPFLDSSYPFFDQSSEIDRNLTVTFLRYWTNFAKTGDPNRRGNGTSDPFFDEDLANWPKYTIPELEYFDINPMSSSGRAYRANKCAFWNKYIPKLEQFTADLSESEESWRNDYYSWKYNDLPEWKKTFNDFKDNKVCN